MRTPTLQLNLFATIGFVLLSGRLPVQGGPAGMTVQSGTATVAVSGMQTTITASQNAFLNWQSFNLSPGETTRFVQPSSASVVWNRINDANPSSIYGTLEANGTVVLMNQSGFYFGPNSHVNAAGLIVSTAPVAPIESSGGLFWQFNGPPPSAKIVNYGHLNVQGGGPLFLIGANIENHGELSAKHGILGLFAAENVLVSSRPDGSGLSASVQLPSGSINNSGQIVADAGTIALHAKVVNQGGLVQADSVQEKNGVIELVASQTINLGANSLTSAHGDDSGKTKGGEIRIKSDRGYTDNASAQISVAGGPKGGDAGSVEISAPSLGGIHASIDGHAEAGNKGGRLLIDPTDIVIGNSGSGTVQNGTVSQSDSPTTLNLNVNSAFLGFSEIDLQASRNITLSSGTTWDLSASTGKSDPGSHLTLEAGNNITLANGSSIVGADNWSVTLKAGRDFSSPDLVKPGVGNVSLAGTASIQTSAGGIDLHAGNNLTIASGFVRTIGGGNVSAEALAGNINTGTRANGYLFRPTGYLVDPDLGGISTAAGGNVSLTAGQDVSSYLPTGSNPAGDAGSGALGPERGDVTVKAGRDVQGHFVVANGAGSIEAGRDAGASTRLLALSLVSGNWEVNATRDVLLQEVRNPNGIFNNLGFGSSVTKHAFDYSADASVTLNAGNSVQLRGSAVPRNGDSFEQGIPSIYPGRLEITAGAAGVTLANDVILFPSPTGNLRITTSEGGALAGTKPGDLTQLIVSDSGSSQYRQFGDFGISDHATKPVHLGDKERVELTIAGDMTGILLGVPKRAEITIGGNMVNSRFDGQNLLPNDVSALHVVGDIINRNEFTTVPADSTPDLSLFNLVYPALAGTQSALPNQLFYNAQNHTVTFQGRMTGDQLQALLNLTVRTFDANGFPILQADGEPATRSVQILSPAVANQLYAASQDVPLNSDTGYRIGGGGSLDITARNLDLGATVGIVSQGPRANPALAQYFDHGADIRVTLGGNLDMFSTKIASLNGGDISINAGGDVNVGSRTFLASDVAARGIFTTDPSDVSVIARGDINVNGSRVAAYDGGNVTVRSLQGNVDAGTGAGGSATVEKIYVDPQTRQVLTYSPTIPGSGILATTFPRSLDPAFPSSRHVVGDILVETPQGSIIANAGGVVQVPLNGTESSGGTVTLRAGSKNPDGSVAYAGSIDASGSGVIGGNVKLDATADIKGLVFARENIDLNARQNVSVTALAQGNVSVASGGTVSGTIVGVGSVSASGASIDASLLSQNVSASGSVNSSQVGFTQGAAANATSQSIQKDEPERKIAARSEDDSDEKNKKRELPRLTRTVGRVTVVLPPRKS